MFDYGFQSKSIERMRLITKRSIDLTGFYHRRNQFYLRKLKGSSYPRYSDITDTVIWERLLIPNVHTSTYFQTYLSPDLGSSRAPLRSQETSLLV